LRVPQFIAVIWLVLVCALAPAHAEKRVALVIGNDRYANLPANEQLQKAVNDARAVSGALKQIGFEVMSGENVGRQAMLARLDEAAQRLAPGDTMFFFFSGHGVAVNNANYMLPVDVPAVGSGQTASLTGAAIKEDDITDRFLSAGARVTVVVLDACRNNPFASSGTKGIGGEKGLAPHEPPSATRPSEALRTGLISRLPYKRAKLIDGHMQFAYRKRPADRHDVLWTLVTRPILLARRRSHRDRPAGTTTISGQFAHSRKLSFGFSPRSCAAVSGAAHPDGNEAVTGPLHGSPTGTAGVTGGATAATAGLGPAGNCAPPPGGCAAPPGGPLPSAARKIWSPRVSS
jgi:hypothetical protein